MDSTDAPTSPTLEEQVALWEAERGLTRVAPAAVYLSAPITSGRLFLEWRRRTREVLTPGTAEYRIAHQAEVMLPNLQRVAKQRELLRWNHHVTLVIDPTSLEVPGWAQEDYHAFWIRILERHARRVLFLDGWELSSGCALEYEAARRLGLDLVDERFEELTPKRAQELLRTAVEHAATLGLDLPVAKRLLAGAAPTPATAAAPARELYKDEGLDRLARTSNVAQFVSFAPGSALAPRFTRLRDRAPELPWADARAAVAALFERAPEGRVNVRSFYPDRPEGNPFERGLERVDEVLALLRNLGGERGLHTIVNEAIDEADGGISGVCHRGLLDFAPDATPRCVDDPARDTCALPLPLGLRLLERVYGVEPDLRGWEGARVEFSVHPRPRGYRAERTVIWQIEHKLAPPLALVPHWPHEFSRMLGDKSFGLAIADALGFDVPRTLVVTRRLFPFVLGATTGSAERWTRTSPARKEAGYYPTVRGWFDPRAALEDPWSMAPDERRDPDPEISRVEAILVQDAVPALFSGRATSRRSADGSAWDRLLEGVHGEGAGFMQGERARDPLPSAITAAVTAIQTRLEAALGAHSIEWVHDGERTWIVQLNASEERRAPIGSAAVAGWREFDARTQGLEEFRTLVRALRGTRHGIRVRGNVSPLSHLGEIAEWNEVPALFD